MRSLFQTALLLAVFLMARPVPGVVMVPLAIEEMAERATLIVEGTVISKTCRRDATGRIYTSIELQVADVWKGSVAESRLTVVHGGGTLGEQRSSVDGQVEYAPGEGIVGFFVVNDRGEAVTLGLAQGKFHVWKDERTGERHAANPFHGRRAATGVGKAGAGPEAGGPEPLTVTRLKQRVLGGGR